MPGTQLQAIVHFIVISRGYDLEGCVRPSRPGRPEATDAGTIHPIRGQLFAILQNSSAVRSVS